MKIVLCEIWLHNILGTGPARGAIYPGTYISAFRLSQVFIVCKIINCFENKAKKNYAIDYKLHLQMYVGSDPLEHKETT